MSCGWLSLNLRRRIGKNVVKELVELCVENGHHQGENEPKSPAFGFEIENSVRHDGLPLEAPQERHTYFPKRVRQPFVARLGSRLVELQCSSRAGSGRTVLS